MSQGRLTQLNNGYRSAVKIHVRTKGFDQRLAGMKKQLGTGDQPGCACPFRTR